MTEPQTSKRPSSAARINANRRNTMKATGPRTEAGKNISKYNDMTHGMTAQGLIPGEDPAEFEARVVDWCRELGAVSDVERKLVANAALDQWRLDRAGRVEAAA